MSFQDIAAARRMTTARAQLDALDWNVDPDAYQRMRIPSTIDADALFQVLPRRALEPALVASLLRAFPARPIERALIAYDVLRGSLLGTADDALAAQLATELAPLESIARDTAAVARDRVTVLIDAVRATASADDSTLPSLAALVAATADGAAANRAAILAHVRALAKAHLPSLALAFLQILFDRFALPIALELMIELALDSDQLDAVPTMPGQDNRSMQLQTYLMVRASLAQYDVAGADKLLTALRQHPGVARSSDPSLILVEAQLALMEGKRLDSAGTAAVASIANAALGWRYARAVADAAAIPGDPEGTPMRVDAYVTTFGNDARVWGQAALTSGATPALSTLLARELRYGSHDPEVWRALSLLTDEPAISDEVTRRTSAQLVAALA